MNYPQFEDKWQPKLYEALGDEVSDEFWQDLHKVINDECVIAMKCYRIVKENND